ncbi:MULTISPECIES: ImmA/IrrE family metallo-endopeptidase [Alphaproteobacteria]|uniref:ImmA/IrrE family metallo-endopeptidase n=1 Tax=Alphaproteobacteria TaxID=28211 RepID=UPI0032638484
MKTVTQKLKVVNNYIDNASVPIQVVPLANDLGIKVYNTPWPDNISGKIQKDQQRGGDSGFAIFVNKNHHKNRRRFTIAHEIAHYVLHEDKIGDGVFDDALYRSGLSNRAETQANALAADILMPWRILNKYVETHGNDVSMLADLFEVSKSAMRIRLGVPVDADW